MDKIATKTSIDLVTGCSCYCAKHKVSLIRFKNLNAICIGCWCLLGIGVAGLSSFFIYKLYKINKRLSELESHIEKLNIQLNLIDDYNDQLVINNNDAQNQIDEAVTESGSETDTQTESDDEDEEQSDDDNFVKVEHKSRGKEKINIDRNVKLNLIKSFESLNDLVFETPSTSPERSTNKDSFYVEKKELSDNEYIEKFVSQNYQILKDICQESKILCNKNPDNINECINYIRALYVLAEKEIETETKKNLQFEAFDLAKRCVEMDGTIYLSHKWFSMTIGRISDHLSLNDKVKCGFDFKKHLDLAININDSDWILYYLRGRWYFRMCNLSWLEKNGVRLLNGSMPDVSIDDAMKDFLKVEQLNNRKSKGNLLYLSKCLISKNDLEKAEELLNIAISLPTRTTEHKLDNEEIESIMKKYKMKKKY